MIRSYFKIAWRNLTKHKMFSVINVCGLAMGMAVATIIGLWVYDEVTYNRGFNNYERIAQVYRRNVDPFNQNIDSYFGMPQPVAKVLTEKYGHLFKHVALLWWDTNYTLLVGETSFVKVGQFIDSHVIDMFSLSMIQGTEQSLTDPHAIIVSESTAKALFGDKDPINQFVKLNANTVVTVRGVYKDIASNSVFGHIQFFANFEGLKDDPAFKANETNWGHNASRIYVQVADNITLDQAEVAIRDLYVKDTPNDVAEYSKKHQTAMWLHPLKDWYLYSEFKDGQASGGRITIVWLFTIVGVFVLLLACINFMNLSTAQSEKRAKEVGIRKAIGSLRSQLVKQFLSESFLVVFLSLAIALLIVTLTLTPFNELTEKRILLPFTNGYFWITASLFLLFTSFVSGLYPAFYLSSFQPVKVLKGTIRLGRWASLPRKVLVVMQGTVSVALIIGTIAVYQQIEFAKDRPVGYEREGLVRIPIHDTEFNANKQVMKNELLSSGFVDEVGFASSPVTAIWDNWGGFTWKGKNPESQSDFTVTWVNEDYGKTIQWKILLGRDFSREHATDADAVIINSSAAKYLALENPIGEYITLTDGNQKRQIIGVVEDVVATNPYDPVRAGFYWIDKPGIYLGQLIIRLHPGTSAREAMAKIESIQHKLVPASPFEGSFVDEEYNIKFKSEQRIGKLASLFATLAIIISALGLFGLSSFVAEQKTKEIGVRKVVGASVFSIWTLLSKEFVGLVVLSCIIAIPIAWHFVNEWLSLYNYRTKINPMVFVYSGMGAIAITLFTVSFQSIKAALANPVKSLRSE